jgi:hypothetical protein
MLSPRPRRALGRAIVLVLFVLAGPGLASHGAAGEPSVCSLQWPAVSASLGGNGWVAAAPPVVVATGRQAPDYQAQVFEHAQPRRMALVIAEWGQADSPELGPIVYCTVRAPDGTVVEEVGRNPLLCRGAEACV